MATSIDDNAADGKSGKSLGWLLIIRCTRLQTYMLATEKDSVAYKLMKERYIELKVILMAYGVNLTELDRIKECKRFKRWRLVNLTKLCYTEIIIY